ncbi:hypothetical protein BU15DRAFT_20701, partial [Melanogaster broomeanus]
PLAPIPSFCMDPFTFYHFSYGFLECNISHFVTSQLALTVANDPHFRPSQTMPRRLYDPHPPPEYPYLRAKFAYSAVVQLYARSSQLDSGATRFKRLGDTAYCCRFGCPHAETAHHLFVTCPSFGMLRQQHLNKLLHETAHILRAETQAVQGTLTNIASRLFTDDPAIWPQ